MYLQVACRRPLPFLGRRTQQTDTQRACTACGWATGQGFAGVRHCPSPTRPPDHQTTKPPDRRGGTSKQIASQPIPPSCRCQYSLFTNSSSSLPSPTPLTPSTADSDSHLQTIQQSWLRLRNTPSCAWRTLSSVRYSVLRDAYPSSLHPSRPLSLPLSLLLPPL
jgi:hypothetical protein